MSLSIMPINDAARERHQIPGLCIMEKYAVMGATAVAVEGFQPSIFRRSKNRHSIQ